MILNKSKYYNDVIYGQLSTTVLANTIIDHKIFQRLRYIIQLGNMQYVFPSCHHSRFEHSIGTYHLCGEYIKTIKENSQTIDFNKPLLNVPFIKNYLYKKYNIDNDDFIINNTEKLLDDFLIELIKIGALSHDLGHGPYSHLFDEFLGEQSELMNNPNIHHEHRSNALLKMMLTLNTVITATWILKRNLSLATLYAFL
jgi:HD superfamily phosphohydrolase